MTTAAVRTLSAVLPVPAVPAVPAVLPVLPVLLALPAPVLAMPITAMPETVQITWTRDRHFITEKSPIPRRI